MNIRLLQRDEIAHIWEIDRREVVENIYYLDKRELVLKPDYFGIQDWPPGEAEHYTPILFDFYETDTRRVVITPQKQTASLLKRLFCVGRSSLTTSSL